MVRFAGTLFCRIFRLETALALAHASQWSEVTGIGVTVTGFDDPALEPDPLFVGGLAVTFEVVSRRGNDARGLHVYLLRNLSPSYSVGLVGQSITVEWNARRSLPTTPAPSQRAGDSPGSGG